MTIGEFDDEQLLNIISNHRNVLDEFGLLTFSGEQEPSVQVPAKQIERLLDQSIIEQIPGHWVNRYPMRSYFDETHYELTDLGYHTLDYLRAKAAHDWRMMQPENMQNEAERKRVIDAFMKLIEGDENDHL